MNEKFKDVTKEEVLEWLDNIAEKYHVFEDALELADGIKCFNTVKNMNSETLEILVYNLYDLCLELDIPYVLEPLNFVSSTGHNFQAAVVVNGVKFVSYLTVEVSK